MREFRVEVLTLFEISGADLRATPFFLITVVLFHLDTATSNISAFFTYILFPLQHLYFSAE